MRPRSRSLERLEPINHPPPHSPLSLSHVLFLGQPTTPRTNVPIFRTQRPPPDFAQKRFIYSNRLLIAFEFIYPCMATKVPLIVCGLYITYTHLLNGVVSATYPFMRRICAVFLTDVCSGGKTAGKTILRPI